MRYATIAAFLAALALPLSACDVDQTEEGEMPDVEVTGGEAPEYDVDAPEVEAGVEEDTMLIDRPDVDVDVPEDTLAPEEQEAEEGLQQEAP